MFNVDSSASLSEFSSSFESVERDASFFTTGKLPTRARRKVIPLSDAKYLSELVENVANISAVVCPAHLVDLIPAELGCAVSSAPAAALYKIHVELCDRESYFWTSFKSRVAPSARIHPTAHVAETDVIIGENTIVGPNASILERSVIGNDCFVGAGTVIGSEAFEMTKVDGRDRLQRQAGGVLIGNEVVFLSNVAVARSVFPLFTEIGDGCGFDNLVHVAHDCVIDRGAKMTACSMLAGRVYLGEGAYVGPNATISNGVTLGDGAYLSIGSTAVRDVKAHTKVTGNFAIEHAKFIRNLKESIR